MAEELVRLGWVENDLMSRMKSDPGKLAIAAWLRRETTLPLKWIAARVQTGTTKGAKALLHHWMQGQEKPAPKASSCEQLRFQSTV